MKYTSPSLRFWGRVVPRLNNGCWEWSGGKYQNGYGAFYVQGSHLKAHRFSWEIHHGKIPECMIICHKCDNRKCVRPDHLFIGTNKDNTRDMYQKNRACVGERHHSSKLTAESVKEIRSRFSKGERVCDLAREFGISSWPMSLVVKGRVWKHID